MVGIGTSLPTPLQVSMQAFRIGAARGARRRSAAFSISAAVDAMMASKTMSQDRFQEALALHQRGQLALAKPLYEQVLVSQPRHVDALHMLGVIAAQSGEHETAVRLIGGALELNENNAAAHFNRAASSQALGRLDSALA